MGGKEITLRGVFRNGVIVLDQPLPFPDGTHVTVTVRPAEAASEPEVTRLSEEAVREVDQWERQE
jgi:predicted DNA-binding antitoxin AbrB/MazE fold protein